MPPPNKSQSTLSASMIARQNGKGAPSLGLGPKRTSNLGASTSGGQQPAVSPATAAAMRTLTHIMHWVNTFKGVFDEPVRDPRQLADGVDFYLLMEKAVPRCFTDSGSLHAAVGRMGGAHHDDNQTPNSAATSTSCGSPAKLMGDATVSGTNLVTTGWEGGSPSSNLTANTPTATPPNSAADGSPNNNGANRVMRKANLTLLVNALGDYAITELKAETSFDLKDLVDIDVIAEVVMRETAGGSPSASVTSPLSRSGGVGDKRLPAAPSKANATHKGGKLPSELSTRSLLTTMEDSGRSDGIMGNSLSQILILPEDESGIRELANLAEYVLTIAILSNSPEVIARMRTLPTSDQKPLSTSTKRVMTLQNFSKSTELHAPLSSAVDQGGNGGINASFAFNSNTNGGGEGMSPGASMGRGSERSASPSPSLQANSLILDSASVGGASEGHPNGMSRGHSTQNMLALRRRSSVTLRDSSPAGTPSTGGSMMLMNPNLNATASGNTLNADGTLKTLGASSHAGTTNNGLYSVQYTEDLLQELRLLKAELRDKHADLSETTNKLRSAEELCATYKTQLGEGALKQNGDLTAKEMELMKALKEQDTQLKAATAAAAETSARLADIKVQMKDLEKQKALMEEDNIANKAKVNALTTERGRLLDHVHELENDKKAHNEREAQLTQRLKSVQGENDLYRIKSQGGVALGDGANGDNFSADFCDEDMLKAAVAGADEYNEMKRQLQAAQLELDVLRQRMAFGAVAGDFDYASLRHGRTESVLSNVGPFSGNTDLTVSTRKNGVRIGDMLVDEMNGDTSMNLESPPTTEVAKHRHKPSTNATLEDVAGRATIQISSSGEITLETTNHHLQQELMNLLEKYHEFSEAPPPPTLTAEMEEQAAVAAIPVVVQPADKPPVEGKTQRNQCCTVM